VTSIVLPIRVIESRAEDAIPERSIEFVGVVLLPTFRLAMVSSKPERRLLLPFQFGDEVAEDAGFGSCSKLHGGPPDFLIPDSDYVSVRQQLVN
jgi:hypothetical protein